MPSTLQVHLRFGYLLLPAAFAASAYVSLNTRVFATAPDLAWILRLYPMETGTVKFFNATKGFGFIQPQDGSKDVFVHISAVERAGLGTLNEGQQVSFDVVTERGKQAASNLRSA